MNIVAYLAEITIYLPYGIRYYILLSYAEFQTIANNSRQEIMFYGYIYATECEIKNIFIVI